MDVARWIPVGPRYLAHRAEPLVHERLWGNSDQLPADVAAQAQHDLPEAGLDADGRPVAFRVPGEPGEDRVERATDKVTVHLRDGGTATTHFGPSGRPERTVYAGLADGDGEERYDYDDAGRLVAIDEASVFCSTMNLTDRWDFGGRLTVEHDEGGPLRILAQGDSTVWERPTRPWHEELAAAVDQLTTRFLEAIAGVVSAAGIASDADTYGLMLTYIDQGRLDPSISIGLEADRRTYDADEHAAIMTFYIYGELEPIYGVRADDEQRALLRAASIEQPDDPYRVVLGEVVRRLSAADLPGLRKTDDFVAWVAEHDEGLEDKVSSIRIHNAPDAVARWERGWGAQVLPYAKDFADG